MGFLVVKVRRADRSHTHHGPFVSEDAAETWADQHCRWPEYSGVVWSLLVPQQNEPA